MCISFYIILRLCNIDLNTSKYSHPVVSSAQRVIDLITHIFSLHSNVFLTPLCFQKSWPSFHSPVLSFLNLALPPLLNYYRILCFAIFFIHSIIFTLHVSNPLTNVVQLDLCDLSSPKCVALVQYPGIFIMYIYAWRRTYLFEILQCFY